MNELDWDTEPELSGWGLAGSAALLVTAGLYWTAVWAVSGLAPLPILASRALRRRDTRHLGSPGQARSTGSK